MQTGIANVPLHGGQCPPWLFEKMKQLGAAMVEVMIFEYGPAEVSYADFLIRSGF